MASHPIVDAQHHRFIFIDPIGDIAASIVRGQHIVTVYIWDYSAGKIAIIAVDVNAQFGVVDSLFVPNSASPVK
jgi:hypothetical protein